MSKLPTASRDEMPGKLIDESDFRAFVCDNIAAMLTGTNPDYFKATIIDGRI